MNLIANIPGAWVVLRGLQRANPHKKIIDGYRASGDVAAEQEAIRAACVEFADYVAGGLDVHFHVIHPENLPEKGPVVFISNHQSYCDILAYLYVVRKYQVGFIAKDALQKTPVIGPWVTRIRGMFMNRGDVRSSLATINEGVSYLKDGFSLVIFPEGTRSRSAHMAPFKPGSLKLATKARVPIVPVTIDGAYRVFEEKEIITKGCTVDFLIHPPIDTASMDRQTLAALPEQVEATVRGGLDILRGQNRPA